MTEDKTAAGRSRENNMQNRSSKTEDDEATEDGKRKRDQCVSPLFKSG